MKMRTIIVIIVLACLASVGCSTIQDSDCYAEAGIGVWVKKHGLVEDHGLYGSTPTTIDLYCQKGNWSAGWYHTSDVGRGFPFNNQHEYVDEKVLVKYRVQIK